MQRMTLSPATRPGSLAFLFVRQAGFSAGTLLAVIAVLGALALAAAWLLKPPVYSLETLTEKYATPASQFADLGGVRTHYMDEGSGPAIVIMHASFMNLRSWDAVAETLAKKYRVIRLDFLASGLTHPEPDDRYTIDRNIELVSQLVDKLGIEQFAVVGTSSGGIVAFNFAARFPEQVSRLILINSAGMPRNVHTDPNRARGSSLSRWLAKNYPTRELMRDNLDINFIEPHEPPDWLVNMNYDMSRRDSLAREGALILANFRTGDPQTVLAQVKAPTMVGWGLDNPTVFHLEAEVIAHWLTSAPSLVKKYPGVGHYPYIEEPDMIAGEIDSFLSGDMDAALTWQHRRPPAQQADAAQP